MAVRDADAVRRLGRAVVFVHQHEGRISDPLIRAEIETLLVTGRAMDFAARLRGHGRLNAMSDEVVRRYARFAGVGSHALVETVLPALKRADLIDYRLAEDNRITDLQEFVGVTASVTEQTVTLLDSLSPGRSDLAFLHSVEIGAIAPLGRSIHLEQLGARGYSEFEAEEALRLARAVGLNMAVYSADLNEEVIFSPYVWGTKQLSLSSFMASLPTGEREALLGLTADTGNCPEAAM